MLTLLVISLVLNLVCALWIWIQIGCTKEDLATIRQYEKRIESLSKEATQWEDAYFRAKDRHMNDSEEWLKTKTHLINKIKERHKELKR